MIQQLVNFSLKLFSRLFQMNQIPSQILAIFWQQPFIEMLLEDLVLLNWVRVLFERVGTSHRADRVHLVQLLVGARLILSLN